MKKVKMSIMKWLGIYEQMLQLELELDRVRVDLEDARTDIQHNTDEIENSAKSYEVEEIVNDSLSDMDIWEYEYGINEIIDSWMSSNANEYISEGISNELEHLSDSDTIREIVSTEIDNHPVLSNLNTEDSTNTTWDMNEIIQEVIEEITNRLK